MNSHSSLAFERLSQKNLYEVLPLAECIWREVYREILSLEQIDYMLEMFYSESVLAEKVKQPKLYFYLVKENQNNIGFFEVEIDFDDNTAKLHKIYLLPEVHGMGFGKKVLDFAEQIALEHQQKSLVLNVNKQNPAKSFYLKQGFTVYDQGVFDIGNGFVMDDDLMKKTLKSSI